jgi:hypothetical protein
MLTQAESPSKGLSCRTAVVTEHTVRATGRSYALRLSLAA